MKRLHEILAFHIDASPKTQRQIAEELGYEKPNLITMFKKGHTPVPIAKIPKFAEILGIDPVYLLRAAMNEYMPEVLETITGVLGFQATENERKIINYIRQKTDNGDPEFYSSSQQTALDSFCDTLI